MARKPILPIRLDEDAKTRWKEAADEERLPLAEFVRRTVDDAIARRAAGEEEAPLPAAPRPAAEFAPPAASPAGGKVFKGMDPKEGRPRR